MSAIDQVFQQLRSQGRKAFIPFVTAGDPDLDFTADVLRELGKRGCSLCEIGVPYSDPIADGPVIQASYTRALERKIKLREILGMTARVSREIEAPLVTMVSYAIVYRHGLEAFVREAKETGVAGAIVPDLLVEESGPLAEICRREDFSLIQLVTPTTPRERAVRIADASSGFLYCVSVTGITGERRSLPPQLLENIAWLREQTELPLCIGFGVSQPEHVQQLAPVADGVIVGSAIVRRIAEAAVHPRDHVLADVGRYVESLMAALNPDGAA
ncbi:MAG: tryptophan synthase subunit alpha [Planctomycetes bacterium]|nr:tryptophan synthase subunit alpha [Planctomycetota bacterium]